MKIPNFLRELINSNEYADKNSDTYVRATKYMNLLYPGQAEFDSTGKMTEPPYDMTYEQFLEAQKKLKEDIENAIQEAEEETEEEKGLSVDYSEFIETEETIDVRVLMPSGYIYNKKLVVYTLNIPEESHLDNPQVKKIWVWHSESDEFICEDCAAHDDELFENTDEIPELPVHPNCHCWVEEITFDEDGNIIRRSHFAGNRPADKDMQPDKNNQNTQEANNMSVEKNNDRIRTESIHKTMAEEGGYIDNPNRIDQPTNSGITQPTLNKYNQIHPEAEFPENVRELTGQQAEQIYTELYYNDRNIGNINNPRIAHAIFDMGVMSNYSNVGRMVQNTINETQGITLAVDGDIGKQTIQALNNIPANQVDRFMEVLIENRIEYLKGLAGWDRYGRGWEARTKRY